MIGSEEMIVTVQRLKRATLVFLVGLVLVPAMARPTPTHAFEASVHEQIVTAALSGKVSSEALSLIRLANVASDADQFSHWRHFDNAPTPAVLCQEWSAGIDTLLKEAVQFSAPEGDALASLADRPTALKAFGNATHAIEDFYSHTNWVELSLRTPGMPRLAPLFSTSCDLGAFPRLQSGYYNIRYGLGGCPPSGPPPPFEYCHSQLNKDGDHNEGHASATGAMTYHQLAVQLATEATAELWDTALYDRIKDRYTRALYTRAFCVFHKLAWKDTDSCWRTVAHT
jgi:hypothetical protein